MKTKEQLLNFITTIKTDELYKIILEEISRINKITESDVDTITILLGRDGCQSIENLQFYNRIEEFIKKFIENMIIAEE